MFKSLGGAVRADRSGRHIRHLGDDLTTQMYGFFNIQIRCIERVSDRNFHTFIKTGITQQILTVETISLCAGYTSA